MVCHGAHTYVYSQVIVHILAQEPRGGAVMKRLCQEITRCAQQRYNLPCLLYVCCMEEILNSLIVMVSIT